MNPFSDRPGEWELYNPLVGTSMLELGNKKNGRAIYKDYFEALGYRHVSVDLNGQDGALKLDLTKPLMLGTFDMVSNIGTTEHVSHQEPCWKNIIQAMHIGSVLVTATPFPGGSDWWWHGEWYPDDNFFRDLAALNGLAVERLYIANEEPRRMWFARLRRVEERPFEMPSGGMHYNKRRPR